MSKKSRAPPAKVSDETIAAFKESFSLFDRDSDGEVNLSDLNSMLSAIGVNATSDELAMLMAEGDVTGKNSMDFTEFLDLITALEKSPSDMYEECFKVYDPEGTGYIDVERLGAIISSFGEKITPAELEAMVQHADLDEDGKISYQDFCSLMLGDQ